MKFTTERISIEERRKGFYLEFKIDNCHVLHCQVKDEWEGRDFRLRLIKQRDIPKEIDLEKVDGYYRIQFWADGISRVLHSEKVNLRTANYLIDKLVSND